MFEFEIPEDYSSLTEGNLSECIAEAYAEFHLLNDSEALDDETLDRMTALADGIGSMYGEIDQRIDAAKARKSSCVQQIKRTRFAAFLDKYGTPDEIEEDEEEAAEGAEQAEEATPEPEEQE